MNVKHVVYQFFINILEKKHFFNTKEECQSFIEKNKHVLGQHTKLVYFGKEVIDSESCY